MLEPSGVSPSYLITPTGILAARAGRLKTENSKRSEEHTSELQSHHDIVCRLLLECSRPHPDLHSFPTRRSSDLEATPISVGEKRCCEIVKGYSRRRVQKDVKDA